MDKEDTAVPKASSTGRGWAAGHGPASEPGCSGLGNLPGPAPFPWVCAGERSPEATPQELDAGNFWSLVALDKGSALQLRCCPGFLAFVTVTWGNPKMVKGPIWPQF